MLDPIKGANIVITGGAGMIGSTIARMALNHGARVTVLDAMATTLWEAIYSNLNGVMDQIDFLSKGI